AQTPSAGDRRGAAEGRARAARGRAGPRLRAGAAARAAKEKADQTRPPLQAAKDFMAEAKKLGLEPIETTMAKLDRVPGLAGTDTLEDAAFALAQGGVSAPVSTPAGLVLLRALGAIPAGVPPPAEVKAQVAPH